MQDISLTRLERLRARLPRIARTTVVASVAVLCVWVLLANSKSSGISEDQLVTSTVKRGSIKASVRGVGSLRSSREKLVLAPADGLIEEINVTPGATVESGAVLLRIQSDELEREKALAILALADTQTQLANREFEIAKEKLAAQAYIVQAQVAYERASKESSAYQELARTGIVSRLDGERAQAQESSTKLLLENARSSLAVFEHLARSQTGALRAEITSREQLVRLAEEQLGRLTITSSFRATVLSLKSDEKTVGNRVSRGDRILRLVDLTQITAEIRIPSAALSGIEVGSSAEVIVFGKPYPGRVASIDPTVLDQYVTVSVELLSSLPPAAGIGLQVEGSIMLRSSETGLLLELPDSVHDTGYGVKKLYQVSDDGSELRLVNVKLGGRQGSVVLIESGLDAGAKVVVAGLTADETRVRIDIQQR